MNSKTSTTHKNVTQKAINNERYLNGFYDTYTCVFRVLRTLGTIRDDLGFIINNSRQKLRDFGGVLRIKSACRHKMAGPRLGVSPIACQPPSRRARNPP